MKNIVNKNKVLDNTIILILIIVILGQRIAINISDIQFSVSFLILFILIFFWLANKQIKFDKKRLILFLVSIISVTFSASISSIYSLSFSITSILLLLILYFPTVLRFTVPKQILLLKTFQTILLFLSIIGILQFISQFIGLQARDWLSFLPKENILLNYNYMAPIEFGSNIYKSNGIFFAEPSFFSQFVSLSIIIELYLWKRYNRILILLPALLFSFSGTGLILLMVGLFPLLYKMNWKKLLPIGILFISIIIAFIYSGFATYTLKRVEELRNPYTSGYIRFISPYSTYWEHFKQSDNFIEIIFGMGPGVSEDYQWHKPTYFNPLMKLVVEYGLFGLPFFAYLIFVFFSSRPYWLSLILFIFYSILSGGLLTPQITVIHYLLLIFHKNDNLQKSFTIK